MVVDFYFTPITGQEGDDLEMYTLAILNPEYRPSVGPQQMMVFTSGAVGAGWRLKFEATPPETDFPEKQHRLYDAEITSEDTSYGDVFGWSEEDLRERLDSRSYVNDAPHNGQNRVYNITADTPVDLRYELWGTPYERLRWLLLSSLYGCRPRRSQNAGKADASLQARDYL